MSYCYKSLKAALFVLLASVVVAGVAKENKRLTSSKLVCYYGNGEDAVSWKCSHVVLPQEADVEAVREKLNGVKILLSVDRINEKLFSLLKSSKVDGLDINLKKLDTKHDITDLISTIRTKLNNDLFVALSVPSKSETLAKHYDFKALSKHVDLFILQTAFLGPSKNVTFHPSRLSGLWDMQNTDSVVDLVTGLGAPLSKLVVAAPVQAFKFNLQDKKHTAPGSPALEVRSITRDELCETMSNGANWTLERDQDQAGPYVFSEKHWIAFDDPTSIDIKAKYTRVRGLAGLALKDLSLDGGAKCGGSLLDAAYNGLSRQSRAPRAAVLHSLEREILETPTRPLDTVQVSPYRISRVIDVEGNVHVIRQDTRTEFECSRQGYFVHPRSCGRFYRCVKFDQLSDDFNVFEFDCPAGLTFDNKFEVCVWPGSLSYSSACSGSSEIAPVPRERFICPGEPGYYADPENCRWFFACLDHGKSPLSAYEFRCPFGLVYDEERLVCEWPWLVPKCASAGVVLTQTQEFVYGNGFKALEQYDGLGHLGVVKLGGLTGGFVQAPAKVYTSAGQAILDHSNIGGIDISQLGVSSGIARAQEDARVINEGLRASVRPPIGNINIGGGGYSAVGVAASASNADIQYSHDGSSIYDSLAAFPNAFSNVASVPFVSSVPIPTLNVSELGLSNGEVIANIPQRQYKFKSNSNLFFENLGNDTLFVNYVSSTPSPFIKLGERYEYANTAIPFAQNSGAKITVVSSTPATSYVETSEGIVAQPVVPIFRQEVSGGPIVSTYNYQQGAQQKEAGVSSVSYSGAISTERPLLHQQPIIEFGQKLNIPVVQYGYQNIIGASAQSAGNSGFQYQEQGKVQPVVEQKVEFVTQAPVLQYSYQNGGAKASEGAISFQQQQQQVVSEPVVEQKVQFVSPAPVVQYNYQSAGAAAKAAGQSDYQYQQQVVTAVPVVEQKVQFVTPAPVLQYNYQNAAKANSYQYQQARVDNKINFASGGSYEYKNPAYNAIVPAVNYSFASAPRPVSGYSYQNVDHAAGYAYTNPTVKFEATPAPAVVAEVKPAIVTYSTPAPIVQQKVSYTYPEVVTYSTPAPVVQQKVSYSYPEVITYSTPAPVVQQKVSYSYPEVITYSTPAPVVQQKVSYSYPEAVTYSTPAPIVKETVEYTYTKPAEVVVSTPAPVVQQKVSYSYPDVVTYSTPAPVVKESVGYNYPKPNVVFEEKPAVVVESYNYPKPSVAFEEKPAVGYSYPKPSIAFEVEQKGYNYPKPVVAFEEKPIVVEQKGYSYPTPTVTFEKPIVVEQKGYSYPKPTVTFEEKPIVVEQKGYSYPKPAVTFEERPIVVEQQPAVVVSSTVAPLPAKKVVYEAKSYQYQKPVFKGYDYPKPAVAFSEEPVQEEPILKKTAYVTGSQYQKQNLGGSFEYVAPVVVSSPPPPALVPVQEEPIIKKTAYVTGSQYQNQQQQQNLGGSFEYVAPSVALPAPQKKYSQSVDASYAYYNRYNVDNAAAFYANQQPAVYVSSTPQPAVYVSSTPQPTVYVSSTPKPTFATVIANAAKLDESAKFSTQSPAVSRYVFSSLDEEYQTNQRPTTFAPAARVATPKTTYLPVASSTARVVESYEASSQQPPVRLIKVAKPKATMIVKQNDFHPLLSAKLGAQCTCVSNTLKLKKPPTVIVTTTPESIAVTEEDNESIEIENYRAPGTLAPEITIKSTTNPIQPAPAPSYAVKKRVRVRPTTTLVYEEAAASEKTVSDYSDKELADTVRKGLNLIKTAAKEGAKEALNSPSFDRYGPGGWRSRDETLQGTIDCQRAGLFRHPSQCNKFYACRWDCDKKRFTLHVFNCPVHLTFDSSLGACNWPSQGPACLENTLLPSE